MKKIYSIFLFAALLVVSTNVSAQAENVTYTNISIARLNPTTFEVEKTWTGTPVPDASDDFSGITIEVEEFGLLEVTMTVNSNTANNVERTFNVGKIGDGSMGNWTTQAYNQIETPGTTTSLTTTNEVPLAGGSVGLNILRLSAKVYFDGSNESTGPNDNANSGWATPMDLAIQIFADGTLSTSNKNAFQFALYPNPAKDVLNINTQEAISNVSVIDMLGRVVLQANNVSTSLDISSLKSAMYIVKLASDKGVSTKRFIKL